MAFSKQPIIRLLNIVLFAINCMPVSANDQAPPSLASPLYKGEVRENARLQSPEGAALKKSGVAIETTLKSRLPRPLLDAKTDFSSTKLKSNIRENRFFSDANKFDPNFVSITPSKERPPLFADTKAAEPLKAGSSEQERTKYQPTESAGGSALSGGDPEESQSSKRKFLIRLKRFNSLSETEIVWEAARAGTRWIKKGYPVTIVLDMDAVHAADKNDTGGAWWESSRGNNNSGGEKASTPQQQLEIFVMAGGRLVVSQRWKKVNSISDGVLLSGAELLNEDEIDDLLLDPSYTVVNY